MRIRCHECKRECACKWCGSSAFEPLMDDLPYDIVAEAILKALENFDTPEYLKLVREKLWRVLRREIIFSTRVAMSAMRDDERILFSVRLVAMIEKILAKMEVNDVD